MCRSTKSVRLIIAASLIVFIAHHPALLESLEENEEIVDDFANSTVNYWQVGYSEDNSSTIWYLATHGDPPPFGLDSVRPPMEENGGGFIEVAPYSDAPAQIFSEVFNLFPGATVELTYWNIVPFPVLARTTVLILYTEFVDVLEEETVDAPSKSVQVFTAPLPTDPSPGWTTVIIDLKINQPSNVQLRVDGNRANLFGTGLAISRIAIKNGEERSTTTVSTTIETSTLSDVTSSTTEAQTKTISTTDTTRKSTSFPNPTKFDVEKSTAQIPTTTTTSSITTVTMSSPNTTAPSTPVISTTTISAVMSPSTTMTMSSTSITDASPTFPPSSTSTLSLSSETTFSNSETTYSSSTTAPEMPTSISPSSSSPTTYTDADSTTSQHSSNGFPSHTNPSTSSTGSTTNANNVTSTTFTSPNLPSSHTNTTMSSSYTNSPSSMYISTTTPLPTIMPSDMTSQLRGIAIGVSVSIILLVLSCLLFGFLYRRHRRRVYLIEKSQLETGTIRQLEQLDEIPSVSRRTDSDCCSTSSTTASDAPLVPTRNRKSSVRNILDRFPRVPTTSTTTIGS